MIWWVNKKQLTLGAKTTNIIMCALDKNKYNRNTNYSNAHDIWRTLEVNHKGTSHVKESKIILLLHEYKMFKMKLNESIFNIFSRFTSNINVII